jgi:hypothetical protein
VTAWHVIGRADGVASFGRKLVREHRVVSSVGAGRYWQDPSWAQAHGATRRAMRFAHGAWMSRIGRPWPTRRICRAAPWRRALGGNPSSGTRSAPRRIDDDATAANRVPRCWCSSKLRDTSSDGASRGVIAGAHRARRPTFAGDHRAQELLKIASMSTLYRVATLVAAGKRPVSRAAQASDAVGLARYTRVQRATAAFKCLPRTNVVDVG